MVVNKRQFYEFKKLIKEKYPNYMLIEFDAYGSQKFFLVSNYDKDFNNPHLMYLHNALEVTDFIPRVNGQFTEEFFKDYLREFNPQFSELQVENGIFVLHYHKRM